MTRKVLLSIAAVLMLVLAGCSSSGSDSASGSSDPSASGGAVSLKHPTEEGLTIDFPKRPTKLVMDCYAYSSLHEYGIEPAALFGYDCESPQIMGGIDTGKITKIGKDGEIDMEKLAEIRPDAIIGQGSAKGWSWFKDDVNAQLLRVAKFIPLPSGKTVDGNIAAMRTIAEFLGADVKSDKVAQADKDLDAAKKAFSEAINGKGLKFLPASPVKEVLYTGVGFPQMDLLAGLGAEIVGAPKPATGNPWGKVAWEEASKYPADVILIESYDAAKPFTSEQWDSLPAIKAKQIAGWSSKGAITSRHYADWLTQVTKTATAAKKLT